MTGQDLKQKLTKMGVHLADLAKHLGITPQGLNSLLNRKSVKIERLQDVNKCLIAMGHEPITMPASTDGLIPILDIRASAGIGIGLEECENIIGYVDIPALRGCYGIQVYGDSMRGKYDSGDTIFVRPVADRNNIQWGHSYAIKNETDLFVKQIYKSNNSGCVRLVSYNSELTPSGERAYPDRDIHVNQNTRIYKVEGSLRLELI